MCIRDSPIHCEFLSGESVTISKGNKIYNALLQGGVVLLPVFLEVGHYVLLTGIEDDNVILFDPYYEEAGTDVYKRQKYRSTDSPPGPPQRTAGRHP